MQISIYISYAIVNVYVFSLIQLRGKNILIFLYKIDINIDSDIERRIGIKAIIIQLTISLIVTLAFLLSTIIFDNINNNNILYNSNFYLGLITGFILSNNFFSLLALLAYFCYVIQQKLIDIEKDFTSLSQLLTIFKQLLIIQNHVKKFRQFYRKFLYILFDTRHQNNAYRKKCHHPDPLHLRHHRRRHHRQDTWIPSNNCLADCPQIKRWTGNREEARIRAKAQASW